MAAVQQNFQAAVAQEAQVIKKASHAERADLYGLKMQATNGDNTEAKPGILKMHKKRRWEAYEAKKGMPRERAMQEYVHLTDRLRQKPDRGDSSSSDSD